MKLRAKNMPESAFMAEFDAELPAPYTKQLYGFQGLWELRVKLVSDITRIFYFFSVGNRVLSLHASVKKSPYFLSFGSNRMGGFKENVAKCASGTPLLAFNML